MFKNILKKTTENKIDNIILKMNFIFRFCIFILFLISMIFQEWLLAMNSIIFIFLSFIPAFFENNFKIQLPVEFDFLMMLFLFLSIILGDSAKFYELFFWWDGFLHFLSGILIGFLGFILIYIIFFIHKIKASPILLVFISFSFSITIGVIWEIVEFVIDIIFDTTLQNGLFDTMKDLILATTGALIVGTFGYLHLKFYKNSFVKNLIKRVLDRNKKNKKWKRILKRFKKNK